MRRPDWVARLRQVVEVWQTASFQYGSADCGRFAAACVDAVTGSDLLAELAAQYSDERTAVRFLAREGGIEAAVSRRLGPPSPPNALPRRGDVCLVPGHDGLSLGVSIGTTVAALNENGLEFAPLSEVVTHWRVG